MDKSTHFSGTPIIKQILKFILPSEEVQIWSALIVQLIMLVVQKKIKRKWAYSNMASVMRFHLMTYINLFKFLGNPSKQWIELTTKPPNIQPKLFE